MQHSGPNAFSLAAIFHLVKCFPQFSARCLFSLPLFVHSSRAFALRGGLGKEIARKMVRQHEVFTSSGRMRRESNAKNEKPSGK